MPVSHNLLANRLLQKGFDELLDIAVQHRRRVASFVARAQVLHHVVGEQHIGPDLITPASRHVLPLQACLFFSEFLLLQLVEPAAQDLERNLFVLDL